DRRQVRRSRPFDRDPREHRGDTPPRLGPRTALDHPGSRAHAHAAPRVRLADPTSIGSTDPSPYVAVERVWTTRAQRRGSQGMRAALVSLVTAVHGFSTPVSLAAAVPYATCPRHPQVLLPLYVSR